MIILRPFTHLKIHEWSVNCFLFLTQQLLLLMKQFFGEMHDLRFHINFKNKPKMAKKWRTTCADMYALHACANMRAQVRLKCLLVCKFTKNRKSRIFFWASVIAFYFSKMKDGKKMCRWFQKYRISLVRSSTFQTTIMNSVTGAIIFVKCMEHIFTHR